jgi:scyllo-inositol 2-dehydrogenase (NADP+)
MVRVALVGYGLSGRFFHRPLISAVPGLHLVTVVTSSPERRAEARRDLGEVNVARVEDDGWLEASAPDLVVVATPTGTHLSLASRALAAGCHVVVEKPVAADASGARALAEAADQVGRLLVPFHNRRWDADHLTLQQLLADGVLGDVLRYESRFERWRPETDPSAWRQRLSSRDGGGVLLDLGVHLVDQAVALFGPAAEVYAEIEERRGGADDDVFLALHHHSGVVSHLWAGAMAAAPGPRLRVLGSAAAYVHQHLDGQEAALRSGRLPGDDGFGQEAPERWGHLHHGDDEESGPAQPVRAVPGRWVPFYAELLRSLEAGAPPPVTADEAVAVLDILDAARASAAERRVVGFAR